MNDSASVEQVTGQITEPIKLWSDRLAAWINAPDRASLRPLLLTFTDILLPFAPLGGSLLHIGSPLISAVLPMSLAGDLSGLAAFLNDHDALNRLRDTLDDELLNNE